jgi:hypothetical protein
MTTSICTVAAKALSFGEGLGEAISGIKFIAQTRVRDKSGYRPVTFS